MRGSNCVKVSPANAGDPIQIFEENCVKVKKKIDKKKQYKNKSI